MSTYQPPGGQQPEPAPGYAQPQDPWAAGPDQELASLPTDPIPQQYGSYPAYPQSDVWTQPTAAQGGQFGATVQGGPYGYVPQPAPRPNRTGVIVLILLAVLVLGGGGGVAAWWFTTERTPPPQTSNSPVPSSSVQPSGGPSEPVTFDPYQVKVGDCLINKGTAKDPQIEFTACTTAGSYKVIKIEAGAGIPENGAGKFDDKLTSVAMCGDTNYETWYGYQDTRSDDGDLFFCMTNN